MREAKKETEMGKSLKAMDEELFLIDWIKE